MTRGHSLPAAVAAALCFALACDMPADSNSLIDPPAFEAGGNSAHQSVTGRADFTVVAPTPGSEGFLEEYSFSAVDRQDGGVNGEFEAKFHFFGQDLTTHGEVLCFTIVGTNQARLGGLITASNAPAFPVGDQLLWSVTDNGEGSKASPDLASPMGSGDAAAWCASGAPATFSSDQANIQVHS